MFFLRSIAGAPFAHLALRLGLRNPGARWYNRNQMEVGG
jgi:hypothetical protein